MRWRSWSWLRRTGWALVIGAAVALAVALPARALSADESDFERIVGWANILAFSMGVPGLVLLALDRKRQARDPTREVVDQAADDLANRVLERESRERARLLGTASPSLIPANTRFDSDALVEFQQLGAGCGGNLSNVLKFYREQTNGRLVILGDPGSGKTVLALELLIQLLEQRRDRATAAERARDPVPVRLSLPAWNTDQPLLDWLTTQLIALFGLPDEMAGALVRTGRVLPVLDGLDEMDAQDQFPIRASQAVRRLNEYLSGREGAPLVLTCRTEDYRRVRESVRPAVDVRIQLLIPQQIIDYLRRVTQAHDAAGWPAWQRVLSNIADPHDHRMLEQLNTPWRLTLAATFSQDRGDVTELMPTATERASAGQPPSAEQAQRYAARVTSILFNNFIPARTYLYGGDRYTADQVTEWLHHVAGHLKWQARHNLSGSDIVLHQWWAIADRTRVKRWQAILSATLTMIVVVISEILGTGGIASASRHVRSFLTPLVLSASEVLSRATLIILLALPFLAALTAQKDHFEPTRVELQQLRTYQGKRRLAGGLAVGLTLGLMLALMLWLATDAFAFAFALGPGAGLVAGLLTGLEPLGAIAVDPRDPLRNDLLVWMAVALGFGLALGLGFGLAVGLTAGLLGGLPAGLLAGLALGLALNMAGNAWLRYAVAVTLAAHDSLQPMRLGAFLHWANSAGILRISGNAYQFRHGELRDWLQRYNHPNGRGDHSAQRHVRGHQM